MKESRRCKAAGATAGNLEAEQGKRRSRLRYLAGLAALAMFVMVPSIVAAEGAYNAELVAQRVSSASSISSLSDNLFGDQIDWYSGSTSFAVTDVSLPGNGSLPVAVGRIHHVGTQGPVSLGLFGNWDIDIPHVYATFVRNEGWAAAPCSSLDGPPTRWIQWSNQSSAGEDVPGGEYWDGNHLHVPGAGDRLMLLTWGVQAPQDGSVYPWTTRDDWHFACIPIKRGTGEGFLARSPDGVRYYFDVAFAREAIPLIYPFFDRFHDGGSAYLGEKLVLRQKVHLYPSRIVDRHGNSVDFNWEMSSANDPRLNSIVANDGRRIDITYKWIVPSGVVVPEDASGYKVDTVTANGRTWRYGYDANGRSLLTKVTLPDTSTWVLSPTFAYPTFTNAGNDPCNGLAWELAKNSFEYTMTHPSGAQGKFLFKTTAHGRANVYNKCDWDTYWRRDKNGSAGKLFAVVALHQKEISGPGLATRVWNVAWNPTPANDASWKDENQGDTTKTVSVTGPGTYTRYTFSNYFGRDEGKLLKEETGASSTQILSIDEHAYDFDSPNPAFTRYPGASPWFHGVNPMERRVIPLRSSQTTRDGVVFSGQINAFDLFARPLDVTRSSSLGYSKTETVEYHDNLSRWILGQVARTTTEGIEVARTDYHAVTALPIATYAFGKLQSTFGYYADGTLATVADGLGNVTTLSNWRRGVPQSVRHPATPEAISGAVESTAVNDDGTIASVTDESGYTTSYEYDSMGRLAKIAYPEETAGTRTYNDTNIIFVPTTLQFGLPAGHWAQVITQGAYRKITHFDAMWRPMMVQEEGGAGTARFTAKAYDAQGREVFSSYPQATGPVWNGSAWMNGTAAMPGVRSQYDALDRVTQVDQDSELGVLTTTTAYQAGFKTLVTNPRQKQTTTSYMAFDQPTTEWPITIDAPEGNHTEISRDVFGKPVQVTRSGQ